MFARAVETSPVRGESGSSLGDEMRAQAAAMRPVFTRVEQACLKAGEQLGEAIPGLTDLAALFEALSGSLESEAFCAATDDLDAIAGELARVAGDLAEEGDTLVELATRNLAIGKRVEDLLAFTRTMSWLVFTLKIESAPLTKISSDMGAFAENIHKLAETTRQALEDYHGTHFRLESLLRAAREAHARFQSAHQARLAAVAAEIREGLSHAAERRIAAVAGLRETSGQSREIGGQIGSCVVALQVGDRTRQRIEHAHDALNQLADALEGRAPALLRDLDEADLETAAARACLLQARQIEGASDEFLGEMDSTVATLNDLIDKGAGLTARSQELFGDAGAEQGSFLAAIETKLTAAREAAAHCSAARASVDQAARSVVEIVEDMRMRTTALIDHVVDVTIIGTNALLRSTRLGDQGKGVALIARELRAYGERTGAIIRSLPEALDGVVERAALLSSGGRLDASSLAALQARMTGAIDIFGATSRDLSAALVRLAENAEANRKTLAGAASRLDVGPGVREILESASEALETAARGFETAPNGEVDRRLDRLLRPVYTMDSERELHDAFNGGRPLAPVARARVQPASVVVDDFLL